MNRISPDTTNPKEQLLSVVALGSKLGYRPELDGLRGISILLVYLHHLYRPLAPAGFLGVDIFFVLSGFLITSLLVEEWDQKGEISLKNFYIRRALRLMPAVFLLILVLALLSFVVDKKSAIQIRNGIWLTLSYISNWFFAHGYFLKSNPLSVTWSLAIEEQFYLTWPLFLTLALKSNLQRRWILSVLALIIAAIPLRTWILLEQGIDIHRLYYGADTRAYGLSIGCLVGLLVTWNLLPHSKGFRIFTNFMAAMGVIFFAYSMFFASWNLLFSGGFALVSLSVAFSLIVVMLYPPKFALAILGFTPLVWIGRISYGLYLWHWTVYWFIVHKKALAFATPFIQWVAMVVLSLSLPALSYHFVEKPFLRWKKQFGSI
jgi:peptidoglycan/LPS O-acetylase OafA/YrhL